MHGWASILEIYSEEVYELFSSSDGGGGFRSARNKSSMLGYLTTGGRSIDEAYRALAVSENVGLKLKYYGYDCSIGYNLGCSDARNFTSRYKYSSGIASWNFDGMGNAGYLGSSIYEVPVPHLVPRMSGSRS
ncbi:uncharacterized protein LOC105420768 isoform X2 [Amborella trichopoda]|uniref:uncharacterized protein LOC105420768 isoform X2 n=1 Tax=Amborella trichopoda TaxID=13333 RepID=UPI0009BCD90E|nr:uncharacterized protein LOC105420768 isoform X2 [Amborella trichopoda]|eukprot:XP_020523944.1 uncharacterized protein LOC105420768 isoform X2 [Amborella trichopoda]